MELEKEFKCPITNKVYILIDKVKGWNLYEVGGVYMVFKDRVVNMELDEEERKPYYPTKPTGLDEWQYSKLRQAQLKFKIVTE